ncbi:NuoM family protein [Paenibacillus thermoaerophilus]|uniref:NuoM family protein n=1 Tax=Paenibacillus thermoaerophilus TaxID=1215385 RepID=A0ABW2V4W2_9BACL|nr:NADH-quinone oxidoreductase subunit M [Paenibacillus thermoaerophilus]TMV12494.1 NADH-quinone oxidoreductase subunit M [Paenibacillus thermoaerophilus]
MLADWPILSMLTFSPLLGFLVLLFVPGSQGRAVKTIGLAATLLPLLLAGWMYVDYNLHTREVVQYTEQHTWIRIPLAIEGDLTGVSDYYLDFVYKLSADGLALPLAFLTTLVSAMAALAAWHIKKRWKTFFLLFLLLETGMLGVFFARDLFLFFLFFELTLIPMFFLIGIWGLRDRERAANKFLLYNGIGSAIMLIAFFIIVSTAGFTFSQADGNTTLFYSGDLDVILANVFQNTQSYVNQAFEGSPFYWSGEMKWTLFILLLIAFGIKLPIFPFHTWMLKVHAEAHPSVVMIHSGILLKMGAYGLLRFGVLLFPEQAKDAALALAIIGVVNILYGALLAMRQTEFRLMLAYSSVSHMGVVLLGLAALNATGIKGAVFQLVSHGLISALLFLIVGSLYERTKTTEIPQLGGLASSMPFMSGMLLMAGMASLGLPGLSGFVSEFMAFLGLFGAYPWVAAVGALGLIYTAVYVLRGIMGMTFGRAAAPAAADGELRDARFLEALPMIVLAAFILLIGIYPTVLSYPLEHTVDGFLQQLQAAAKMGGS